MGTIVVFENISLDGVTQDPTGAEGFTREDWRAGLSASDREKWAELIVDDARGAQALLLGRRSYEYFAARYPYRTGELADLMNGLPKYVLSASLADPDWKNSTVLKGEAVEAVSELKRAVNGDIRVYASSQLVRTLIAHDLVDELRLAIFPLLMGAGDRIFDQTDTPKPLRPKDMHLVGARTIGTSLTHLTYRRIPDTER